MKYVGKITFCGGAGSVTGANFLFEIDGKRILVDCGLAQGKDIAEDSNWNPFIYNPKEIDILFITHAHIDHIGRIPKLIHEGFRGTIYSTPPTKELSLPMLLDTAGILANNWKVNEKIDIELVYSQENIKTAFVHWSTLLYHEKYKITEDLEVSFKNSGHILGSAMIEFVYKGKKVLFTGDLGNSPSPLLPDAEILTDIDYLIIESVYGDRNHESKENRKKMLQKVIEDNYKRRGALIVPTFSLERSQELLFELNDLVENKHIPMMPIYFDSPLAIKLTDIFKKYKDYFNDKARAVMVHDKYIFDFAGLHTTLMSEDSKLINNSPNPKIIIAGSGMSSGGRIVHHERHYLPDPNNTILLTGYQAIGTLGRMIKEGVKRIRITGEDITVRAHVESILGYSGHRDMDGLLEFIEGTQDKVKKIFVVMGEPKSSMFLVQRIKDYLGLKAVAPREGDIEILEF